MRVNKHTMTRIPTFLRLCRNFCTATDNLIQNTSELTTVPINNPDGNKIIRVAIIGSPNTGKSTLINRIVGHTVCGVSKKVHTTKLRSRAAVVRGNVQVLFVDTPGLVSPSEIKRHHLESTFGESGYKATCEANIIGVVHDVSNSWTREKLDKKAVNHLEAASNKKSFLILNKVDCLRKKDKLLNLTKMLTTLPNGWPNFEEVFMVSALKGTGVSDILDYLIKEAHFGQWGLPMGQITDRKPEQLIIELTRAHLLDALPQEVPYNLKIEVEYLHKNDFGELVCVVLVTCPLSRHQKLTLGKGGRNIRKVALKTEADVRDALQCNARVRIVVTSQND